MPVISIEQIIEGLNVISKNGKLPIDIRTQALAAEVEMRRLEVMLLKLNLEGKADGQ